MTLEQKMKHVTKHINNKHYSVKMDIREISDKKTGYQEFFWFVRESGTTLIPSPHIFIKGSTFNLMGKQMSLVEGVKVYFIRVQSIDKNRPTGEIKIVSEVGKYIDKYTCYPIKMTGTIITKDGEEVSETIDYTSDFYDEFVKKCGIHKHNVVKSNVQALYLSDIEF